MTIEKVIASAPLESQPGLRWFAEKAGLVVASSSLCSW